ncbi:hypothetical protein E2C01_037913 [Portunus trituberculatus]|uniref:Uncharacterized protein n=1 Tax=Portunus trituberculatus TaxID=210409 RepID=A0A5B7FGJ4_PORTR|nr:hypothetical protein [Portunus trituberculatus]
MQLQVFIESDDLKATKEGMQTGSMLCYVYMAQTLHRKVFTQNCDTFVVSLHHLPCLSWFFTLLLYEAQQAQQALRLAGVLHCWPSEFLYPLCQTMLGQNRRQKTHVAARQSVQWLAVVMSGSLTD